jgi:hypothetical protein
MEDRNKIELHPDSTGLVVVDMQVEGCERHGPGVKPVIGNIRRLLDRFAGSTERSFTYNPSAPRITPSLPFSGGPMDCCWAVPEPISSRS